MLFRNKQQHLLRKTTWNTNIFLPLLKLVSNKFVHLHTGVQMFVLFWMQHFQTGGLGEMVRHPGHHYRGISPPWLLFMGGYVKDKVFSKPVPDITNLKARITDAFATITEEILENTWREIDYRLDVLRATKVAHVEVYWCVVNKFIELNFELRHTRCVCNIRYG